MRSRPLLVLVLLLLAAAPAAGQAEPTFRILVQGDDVLVEGPTGLVEVHERTADRIVLNLTLPDAYVVGEIRFEGAFPVDRARQVIATWANRTAGGIALDDHFFTESVGADLAHDRLVNYTQGPPEVVLRVGLPGPGLKALVLQRDVTPPVGTIEAVEAVDHRSFRARTATSEWAYADLEVRKVGADAWVQNPTTIPSLFQTFPVQGLDAATDYEFRVRFRDWSGNEATTAVRTVRTAALPDVAPPVVTPLSPAEGARLASGDVLLRARVVADAAPLAPGGLRLFLDLTEVRDGLRFEDGDLTYTATGLAPGLHRARVEATNVAGGSAFAQWTFHVEGAATPGAAAAATLAAVGAALVLLRRP